VVAMVRSFKVAAVMVIGLGAIVFPRITASATSSNDDPTSVTAVALGAGEVQVDWTPSPSANADGVTGYSVRVCPYVDQQVPTPEIEGATKVSVDASATSAVIGLLNPLIAYQFCVQAFGDNFWSSEVQSQPLTLQDTQVVQPFGARMQASLGWPSAWSTAIDPAGNMYVGVTDQFSLQPGGLTGGRVERVAPDGTTTVVPLSTDLPGRLVTDSTGALYETEWITPHAIRKVGSSTTTEAQIVTDPTATDGPTWGLTGSDGSTTARWEFVQPASGQAAWETNFCGLTSSPSGVVYFAVCSGLNQNSLAGGDFVERFFSFAADGSVIYRGLLHGQGSYDGGPPRGLAVGTDGTIYAVMPEDLAQLLPNEKVLGPNDYGAGQQVIMKLTPDGSASLVTLGNFQSLAVDATGNLWATVQAHWVYQSPTTHRGSAETLLDGRLELIEPTGTQVVVATGLGRSVDLALDGNGNAFVVTTGCVKDCENGQGLVDAVMHATFAGAFYEVSLPPVVVASGSGTSVAWSTVPNDSATGFVVTATPTSLGSHARQSRTKTSSISVRLPASARSVVLKGISASQHYDYKVTALHGSTSAPGMTLKGYSTQDQIPKPSGVRITQTKNGLLVRWNKPGGRFPTFFTQVQLSNGQTCQSASMVCQFSSVTAKTHYTVTVTGYSRIGWPSASVVISLKTK
jgi:Fibronectin type III domain